MSSLAREGVTRQDDQPEVRFGYDVQKDTPYIELEEGPQGDNSYATNEGVVDRLLGGCIIGLTICNARDFMGELLLQEFE